MFSRLEPAIHHQFFPGLSEAENQTYMVGMAVFFFCQILWYPFIRITLKKPWLVSKRMILFILLCMDGLILITAYFFAQLVLNSKNIQDTLAIFFIFPSKNLTMWNFLIGEAVSLAVFTFLVVHTRWPRPLKILWHCLSVIIILWLTLGMGRLNLFDYSNYAGPINDLLLGKPILTYRTSYGFLPVIFLSGIFHFLPLTSEYLHAEIVVLGATGFLLYYALLNKVLRDFRWAFFTTIYAIFAQHLVADRATYQIPQQTFIRIGMWILIALALSYKTFLLKKLGKIGNYVPMVLTAISFFWTEDFGLYTLMAYCLYLLIMNLNTQLITFLKTFFRQLFNLFLSVLVVFILINCVYFLWYRSFPMWMEHYFSVYTYQNSGTMLPVPDIPALWIYILILVLSISFFIFLKKSKGRLEDNEAAIVFTACIGLTTFNYFLGRSALSFITVISLSLIVCIFYLLKIILNGLRNVSKTVLLGGVFFISTILAIPGTLLAYQGLKTLEVANPGNTLRILKHQMPEATDEYYWVGPTARTIMDKYGEEIKNGNFTMLSIWDTWFLVIYHTKNRAGLNCLACYYFPADDLSFVVSDVKKSPGRYLFVDHNRALAEGRVEYLLSKLTDQYSYVESIGFLDVYKRK